MLMASGKRFSRAGTPYGFARKSSSFGGKDKHLTCRHPSCRLTHTSHAHPQIYTYQRRSFLLSFLFGSDCIIWIMMGSFTRIQPIEYQQSNKIKKGKGGELAPDNNWNRLRLMASFFPVILYRVVGRTLYEQHLGARSSV